MCTTHYTHLGSVISSPCCPSGTSPTWPTAYQWSPEKHFRVWMQLTCPKISRELLLPQLLSSRKRGASPSLGKSNHLGGRWTSWKSWSTNLSPEAALQVFAQLLLKLPLCGVISIWPNPHVLGILQLQRQLGSYFPQRLSGPTRSPPSSSTSRIPNMHTTDVNIYIFYIYMSLCLCSTRPEHSLHLEISGLQSWDLAIREPGS